MRTHKRAIPRAKTALFRCHPRAQCTSQHTADCPIRRLFAPRRLLTPAQVHCGQAEEVLARRHAVRMRAYDAHPERFINGPPQLEVLKSEVWINKPDELSAPTGEESCRGDIRDVQPGYQS
jgi:hypothetical protein